MENVTPVGIGAIIVGSILLIMVSSFLDSRGWRKTSTTILVAGAIAGVILFMLSTSGCSTTPANQTADTAASPSPLPMAPECTVGEFTVIRGDDGRYLVVVQFVFQGVPQTVEVWEVTLSPFNVQPKTGTTAPIVGVDQTFRGAEEFRDDNLTIVIGTVSPHSSAPALKITGKKGTGAAIDCTGNG